MTDLTGATILQVIPALDAGGAERSTLEIAKGVIEAGGRALVATRGGRLTTELVEAGAEFFSLPVDTKNPLEIAANVDRLAKLIRENGVDLVHARSRAPAWSALYAADRAGAKFVTTYHGAYAAKGPIKRFYNSSMVRSDLVIANSNFTASAIRRMYRVDEDRLAVIPRGADLNNFDPSAISVARVEAVRQAMGLDQEDAFVFVLPARLTEWKGQRIAIAAFAEVLKQVPRPDRLRLVLVGDVQGRDAYQESLLRQVDHAGLNIAVSLPGHLEDMPAVYLASDVVLAPSTRPEAFGRTAVEAGAMGRLTIAAAHGGGLETIVDGETGYLVPPGDSTALTEAMVNLVLMNAAERREIGAAARQWVEKRYSTAAMVQSTLAAYARLLLLTS